MREAVKKPAEGITPLEYMPGSCAMKPDDKRRDVMAAAAASRHAPTL